MLDTILSEGMPSSIESKINELRKYQSEIRSKHGVPDKNKEWDLFMERISDLENNSETWELAQEFWNLDWILSELDNIQSSVEQIDDCIRESKLLSIEHKASL